MSSFVTYIPLSTRSPSSSRCSSVTVRTLIMKGTGYLTTFATGLLTLRLVALYQRKKWVVWFLYSFLTTSYLTTAGLMAFTLYTYGGEYNHFTYSLLLRFTAPRNYSVQPRLPRLWIVNKVATDAGHFLGSNGI